MSVLKTNDFFIAAKVISHDWVKMQGITGQQSKRKTGVYFLTFLIFWVTNLGKIILLYGPVDDTHQAENEPKKEKSCVLYTTKYGSAF